MRECLFPRNCSPYSSGINLELSTMIDWGCIHTAMRSLTYRWAICIPIVLGPAFFPSVVVVMGAFLVVNAQMVLQAAPEAVLL